MSVRCPAGHLSGSADWCDVCGLPVTAAAPAPSGPAPAPSGPAPAPEAAPEASPCPNCGHPLTAADLFCESCGYDVTTGSLPPPLPAGMPGGADVVPVTAPTSPLTWMAEIWVDPDWYATQESDEPCPSPGMPVVVPLWLTSVLVGRRSVSRRISPQIDCDGDTGVSRRHAQLTTDGQRWWVEDLGSANGTYLAAAGASLPDDPVEPSRRTEFRPGDRIYVGAWTRIVVRRAIPGE